MFVERSLLSVLGNTLHERMLHLSPFNTRNIYSKLPELRTCRNPRERCPSKIRAQALGDSRYVNLNAIIEQAIHFLSVCLGASATL